jgi:hypothetical protein
MDHKKDPLALVLKEYFLLLPQRKSQEKKFHNSAGIFALNNA